MSNWVTVAKVGELAPGEWRVVNVDDAPIVVFNLGGEYYAIEDICTHDGGQLTGGKVEGDEIVCPRHGRASASARVKRCQRRRTSRPPGSRCGWKTARYRFATTAGIDLSWTP